MRRQTARHGAGQGDYSFRGHSGNLAYSSSSGSSNNTSGSDRPIVRFPSTPLNRVNTPERSGAGSDRVDASTGPEKPGSQQTSFTSNGHHISETYEARPSTRVSPSKLSPPVSPPSINNNARQRSPFNCASSRPAMRNDNKHWALEQEFKVKILGLPNDCWTKEVYFAMSRLGTVVRIEMQPDSQAQNAFVSFK